MLLTILYEQYYIDQILEANGEMESPEEKSRKAGTIYVASRRTIYCSRAVYQQSFKVIAIAKKKKKKKKKDKTSAAGLSMILVLDP